MLNVPTLGALLRTLQSGEPSARVLAPLQPLAPTQAVKPISPETTQSQASGHRDPGGARHRATGRAATTAAPAPGVPDDQAAVVTLRATAEGTDASRLATATGASPSAQFALDGPAEDAPGRAQEPTPASLARALTASLASATAATAPAAGGTALAASLSLSSAGHLVDALARLPGGEPIRPATPLVPQPATMPAAIAHALQQSIVASGVFYESHLARWALHRQSDATLRREPQAGWEVRTPSVPFGAGAQTPPAASADAGLDSETRATLPAGAHAEGPGPAAGNLEAVPSLLRQQLDVLETGQILWRGEVWPGQPAAIEIADDERTRAPGQAPVWRARLGLTLPGLGAIEARLALSGRRIHLDLGAAGGAAASLAASVPEFARALAERGLDLAPVRIDHGSER